MQSLYLLLARRNRMSGPSAALRQCQTDCALCRGTRQIRSGRSPLPAHASAAAVPRHIHHCSSFRCTLRTNDTGALGGDLHCHQPPSLPGQGRQLSLWQAAPARSGGPLPLHAASVTASSPAAARSRNDSASPPCGGTMRMHEVWLVGTQMQHANAWAQPSAHPLPADLSCHRARHTGCTARGHLHSRTSPPPPWSPPPSRHTQHASCAAMNQITFSVMQFNSQGPLWLFGCGRRHPSATPCCLPAPSAPAAGLPDRTGCRRHDEPSSCSDIESISIGRAAGRTAADLYIVGLR